MVTVFWMYLGLAVLMFFIYFYFLNITLLIFMSSYFLFLSLDSSVAFVKSIPCRFFAGNFVYFIVYAEWSSVFSCSRDEHSVGEWVEVSSLRCLFYAESHWSVEREFASCVSSPYGLWPICQGPVLPNFFRVVPSWMDHTTTTSPVFWKALLRHPFVRLVSFYNC